MKIISVLFLAMFTFTTFAQTLPTANYVEISRYVGKWYAISSLPQFFTKNCKAQTADYDVINEQSISVLNTCIKGKDTTVISGEAVVKNAATNAELIVTFNNFFTRLFRVEGDYTIIKLDSDYRYVMIGSKNRKSLWIMSRSTEMPEEAFNEYLKFAQELNFKVDQMVPSEF
jgi:apolipoprotein D and lipocalin family protein